VTVFSGDFPVPQITSSPKLSRGHSIQYVLNNKRMHIKRMLHANTSAWFSFLPQRPNYPRRNTQSVCAPNQ
jgi:hypothetical protein